MLESNAQVRRSYVTRGAVNTLHRRANTPKELEKVYGIVKEPKDQTFFCLFCFLFWNKRNRNEG